MQIGFLYLRYVADPKTLWNWFESYVRDMEVRVSQTPRSAAVLECMCSVRLLVPQP